MENNLYLENFYKTKDDYERFLNWHFSTCERKDQLGWSSHVLYICKKK